MPEKPALRGRPSAPAQIEAQLPPEPGSALWEEQQDAGPAPTDVLVEQWFVETFHNRGFDVSLYTHFHAAKERLKERLRAAKG